MATFRDINPQQDDYDEYVDETLQDIEQDPEELEDMSDVEIRLEEACCFKALLNNSLFEEPMTPIAARVEKKIRDYIRAELRVLMGLSETLPVPHSNTPPPRQEPQFTSDEEKVLKSLAAKVLSREQQSKQEPTVNQVAVAPAPEAPVVKKSPTTRPAAKRVPATPKVKKPAKTSVKQTMTMPDGSVHEVSINNTGVQTKPPAGIQRLPALSPEQAASYLEQEALTSVPQSGMLGIAVQMAQRGMISPSSSNEDE